MVKGEVTVFLWFLRVSVVVLSRLENSLTDTRIQKLNIVVIA